MCALAVCCSVLQCVAVCCSVLQCVSCDLYDMAYSCVCEQCVAVCCSVLQCVAVCCSVLQCVAVCCSVGVGVTSPAQICNMIQSCVQHGYSNVYTATHCNTLQHTATPHDTKMRRGATHIHMCDMTHLYVQSD